jgi:hypothetical protein
MKRGEYNKHKKEQDKWVRQNKVKIGDRCLVAFEPPEWWWDLNDFYRYELQGEILEICSISKELGVGFLTPGVDGRISYLPFWCLVKVSEEETKVEIKEKVDL